MLQNLIKIGLCMCFLLCLFRMPYGYYQAVRFIGMLGFLLLSYISYKQSETLSMLLYLSLAVLFQPFLKVILGRTGWNITDVIISIGLIGSIFLKKQVVRR